MRKLYSACIAIVLAYALPLQAQDFNCKVTVLDNQIQLTDKRIFRTLEQNLTEFMNNNKWSLDKIQPNEKIECAIQIILSKYDQQSNHFEGTAQIQSVRTAYGTNYNTVLFNFNDENWEFEYAEFQRMDFNENAFTGNLTSLLGFYAYFILGLDYDSYSLLGGNPYFNKAMSVATNAQPSGLAGWKPFERNVRTRYNLVDNIINERFRPIREAYYKYHRLGLDVMSKDPETARKNIYASLELVQKVFKIAPNTVLLISFFEAKADELVNIFKNASTIEKPKVITLLNEINIANTNRYEKIK
jgi:hypothetical protein